MTKIDDCGQSGPSSQGWEGRKTTANPSSLLFSYNVTAHSAHHAHAETVKSKVWTAAKEFERAFPLAP